MYPNIGSGSTQPSAPPPPSSTSGGSTLANSNASKPVGFSSLMGGPPNQSTPYPTGPPSSQSPYTSAPPSSAPYNNPYASNNQPPNTGGSGYQQSPYPPQSNNPYQSSNPSSNFPGGPQPPPPSGYQSPYPPQQGNNSNQNPYRPANPYPPQQGNAGYQNPYPPQQGGYPQQQQQPPPYQAPYGSNSQQQPPPFQNPYGSNPQQPPPFQNPYGANPQGGYPPYNQPQQSYGYQPQQSYGYQPQGGGFNANQYGSPAANDRIRAIAGRYEINDALAQRLNILQQFEIVIVCDDSGSMNAPVEGTNGSRWDELRSIVQIVMEIATVFDSNGVDVHFLNRAPMPNVTDSRQVVESFTQRPGGYTPLTPVLRRIFQSAASKPGSDKRLLVFVATDGAPTDANGTVDIRGLENLMRNERQANTTYVTFLACTDDESSVEYLSQWDRTMQNVDVVDDYKTEREEIRRNRGHNYPFSFGDYVVKALLGAVDPQMDMLDESGNNNNNNFRRF